MYSDRNLVNRRNVKGDVTAAANACRRFFVFEVEARIIAATLQILGMKKLDDDEPTMHKFPSAAHTRTDDKKVYLQKISSLVVDQFVVDHKRNTDMEVSVQSMQQDQDQQPDVYGRFPCRFPGCSKTFFTNLMKNYDGNMSVFNRTGKHVKKSTAGDLEKIVNELVINKAFTCTPGQRYSYFSNVKTSMLYGFDMQKMFSWINAHKKYMILNRKAQ